ncbi:PREDICTED: uncharacterized protein LOC109587041 [Amphimedon queenslandica]|uniref:Death domain-containing protein n=1 Tax=Amphimedon queenslandica TaxID=400682 RepID=A0AAN0JP57_AMPQE|nr:PREDICTED: uncharacterized protein LOC109587041 [Amphimedon queenslandica]|eukprot:XP_019858820.1 PREDICTED: uncharacterized protein LOC109587041 [Amphimedon queenslandica]
MHPVDNASNSVTNVENVSVHMIILSVNNKYNFFHTSELDPGPLTGKSDLFAKYLEPLVDWEMFALCLPSGITQLDVDIIETKGSSYLRMEALHKRWLQVNPTASWRDVINALKQCKENELARTIEDKVTDPTAGKPGPITGNPKDILRAHSVKLTDGISQNLYKITTELHAKGLIPQQTFDDVLVMGIMTDYTKAMKLMSVLEQQLESSDNPKQYLTSICHVLIINHTLTDFATSISHQLGQSIPDNVTSISSIPDDVKVYADNLREHYKHQPIVATDWPPRIGKDFFGRLALLN